MSGRSSGGLRNWKRSPEKERNPVKERSFEKEHKPERERSFERERSSERERSCRLGSPLPLNHTHLEQRSATCTPVELQGQPHSVHSPGQAHTAGLRSQWGERAEDHKLGKEDIRWQ